MSNTRVMFIAIAIVLIVVVGGFGAYVIWSNTAITTAQNNAAISDSQVKSLQQQLSVSNSQIEAARTAALTTIGGVQKDLATAKTEAAVAQAQLEAAKTQLAAQQSEVTSAQSSIAAAKTQAATVQKDLDALKGQYVALQGLYAAAGGADVAALQSQVADLQKQNADYSDILQLKKTRLVQDVIAINQSNGISFNITPFNVEYAGYLVITGQSSTSDSFIVVVDTYPGYPLNETRYPFGIQASIIVPVLPGTVSVSYQNGNPGAVSTGNISVKYIY